MMHIVLWKWNGKGKGSYQARHVNIMVAMLKRNISGMLRIICITDDAEGIVGCETFPLWPDLADIPNATNVLAPSCYRRLKLYDAATQRQMGIVPGDRILSLDLDTVIAGKIDHVLGMQGRFVGWAPRANMEQQPMLNGSLQMFDAGDLQEIWSTFEPKSPCIAYRAGYRGSDQAWLSMNLMGKPGIVLTQWPEVASYPLQIRIQGLTTKTKIIFFHGLIKPWFPQALIDSPFIDRYWRL